MFPSQGQRTRSPWKTGGLLGQEPGTALRAHGWLGTDGTGPFLRASLARVPAGHPRAPQTGCGPQGRPAWASDLGPPPQGPRDTSPFPRSWGQGCTRFLYFASFQEGPRPSWHPCGAQGLHVPADGVRGVRGFAELPPRVQAHSVPGHHGLGWPTACPDTMDCDVYDQDTPGQAGAPVLC